MVDPVEELLQVNIHNISFAFVYELFGFLDGLVGTSTGPEPVTVIAEKFIEDRA
jgi:hypothetical protein